MNFLVEQLSGTSSIGGVITRNSLKFICEEVAKHPNSTESEEIRLLWIRLLNSVCGRLERENRSDLQSQLIVDALLLGLCDDCPDVKLEAINGIHYLCVNAESVTPSAVESVVNGICSELRHRNWRIRNRCVSALSEILTTFEVASYSTVSSAMHVLCMDRSAEVRSSLLQLCAQCFFKSIEFQYISLALTDAEDNTHVVDRISGISSDRLSELVSMALADIAVYSHCLSKESYRKTSGWNVIHAVVVTTGCLSDALWSSVWSLVMEHVRDVPMSHALLKLITSMISIEAQRGFFLKTYVCCGLNEEPATTVVAVKAVLLVLAHSVSVVIDSGPGSAAVDIRDTIFSFIKHSMESDTTCMGLMLDILVRGGFANYSAESVTLMLYLEAMLEGGPSTKDDTPLFTVSGDQADLILTTDQSVSFYSLRVLLQLIKHVTQGLVRMRIGPICRRVQSFVRESTVGHGDPNHQRDSLHYTLMVMEILFRLVAVLGDGKSVDDVYEFYSIACEYYFSQLTWRAGDANSKLRKMALIGIYQVLREDTFFDSLFEDLQNHLPVFVSCMDDAWEPDSRLISCWILRSVVVRLAESPASASVVAFYESLYPDLLKRADDLHGEIRSVAAETLESMVNQVDFLMEAGTRGSKLLSWLHFVKNRLKRGVH